MTIPFRFTIFPRLFKLHFGLLITSLHSGDSQSAGFPWCQRWRIPEELPWLSARFRAGRGITHTVSDYTHADAWKIWESEIVTRCYQNKCYTFGVCFGGVGWWIWWVISWCDDVRENVGRCLCGILFMLWNLGTPFIFNLSHLAILQGLTPGIVRRWISLILHVLCLVQCPGHSLHLLGVKSITC